MGWTSHWENAAYIDDIEGLELVDCVPLSQDCRYYAIGDAPITAVVPGILEHDGNPEPGDVIIYGHDLNHPAHMGVWREDGRVRSQWGDGGWVMYHRWNHIPLAYGTRAFFSTYKSIPEPPVTPRLRSVRLPAHE